jgi:hypothetical protein
MIAYPVNTTPDRIPMNHQTPAHQPDNSRIADPSTPSDGNDLALRLVAGFGLGLAGLAVLALAGGSLKVTSTGITMAVNARQ